MRKISTTIEIDATPEEVWSVLADLPRYPEWNPFIREASGRLAQGATLTLRMYPAKGKARTFRPRVLAAQDSSVLRWLGRFIAPGVFDGEHEFVLAAEGGRTRVTQSERFSGMLVPLVGGVIANTEGDFAALNQALKRRVESAGRG